MSSTDICQRSRRASVLQKAYRLAPFRLEGDLSLVLAQHKKDFLSCLICTARHPNVLDVLLGDLAKQDIDRKHFEVVICDNGLDGSEHVAQEYSALLPIRYFRYFSTSGMIGLLRNKLLEQSVGEFVLFLDDDTRIQQNDFLTKALDLFKLSGADIIMPRGIALPVKSKLKYKFLDSHSFATRCCLYKRSLLERLRGFRSDIAAYEDIEFGIRSSMVDIKIIKTCELTFQHPAFYFESLKKPLAIGQSILRIRRHYPVHIWLMIYLNALSHLPKVLFPTTKNRQWFKISWGVLTCPWVKVACTYHP